MGPKIYVIDDSPLVCFGVERVLGPLGFDIVSERSGRAAIANLPSQRPDLIICDLILPDVGGLEVCQFIHGDPRLSATPVLVISGAVTDEVRARAREYGVREVVKKPLKGDELVQCVERILAAPPPVAEEAPDPPQTKPPQTKPPQTKPRQTKPRQPTARQPTARQPTARQPTAPQPTAPQPTARQPTAPQPTAPQPAAPQSTAPQTKPPGTLPPGTLPPQTRETSARVLTAIDSALGRPGMVEGVRFGLILRTDGEVVRDLGRAPRSLAGASKEFLRLGRQAARVSSLAGHPTFEGLTLESKAGTLLLHPLDEILTVVLVLREEGGLGMARYFVRRLRKMLADLKDEGGGAQG